MPRPRRILYEGAWYHVMNRGINHNSVFLSKLHRYYFLSLLAKICDLYSFEIHAYCLMGNHYHLLIRTPLANLSDGMKYLGGVYTQFFNTVEERDGPLFRGRFKAILVEADAYLCRVVRYIHFNPVKDGFVLRPEDYKWSSHSSYLCSDDSTCLTQSNVLGYFAGERSAYERFIAEGVDKEIAKFYSRSKLDPILGTEKFIKSKLAGRNSSV